MAMKGYSAFPKAAASLEPHHQIVQCHIQDTHGVGVLPLCRGAVGVFYSPIRLGKNIFVLCSMISCCVIKRLLSKKQSDSLGNPQEVLKSKRMLQLKISSELYVSFEKETFKRRNSAIKPSVFLVINYYGMPVTTSVCHNRPTTYI